MDVELEDFFSGDFSDVFYIEGECDFLIWGGGENSRREHRFRIRKSSIAQSVTERKKRRKRKMIVVSVADVKPFAIKGAEVFAGPGVVGWVVGEAGGEGCLGGG